MSASVVTGRPTSAARASSTSGHILRETTDLQVGGVNMGAGPKRQQQQGQAQAAGWSDGTPGAAGDGGDALMMFAVVGRGRRAAAGAKDWVPAGGGSYNTELRYTEHEFSQSHSSQSHNSQSLTRFDNVEWLAST